MSTGFSAPIQGSTLSATTVKLIEMYFSNTTKGPAQGAELPPGVTSPVKRVLVYGTDYTAAVSDDVDSGGKFLKITPLKPLTPSTWRHRTSATSSILTNGIQSADGQPAQPDDFYAAIKAAPADCSSFTDATQKARLPADQGAPLGRGRDRHARGHRRADLEFLDAVDWRHARVPRSHVNGQADRSRADRPDDTQSSTRRCPARPTSTSVRRSCRIT